MKFVIDANHSSEECEEDNSFNAICSTNDEGIATAGDSRISRGGAESQQSGDCCTPTITNPERVRARVDTPDDTSRLVPTMVGVGSVCGLLGPCNLDNGDSGEELLREFEQLDSLNFDLIERAAFDTLHQ